MIEAKSQFLDKLKTDPLFSAEGLDVKRARVALAEIENILEETRGAWKGFITKQFFIRHKMRETVHPMPFLYSFLDSEEKRREAIADPSEKNLTELVALWSKTADLYNRGVSAYREAMKASLDVDGYPLDGTAVYLHKAISVSKFFEWIDLLGKNGDRLVAEVNDWKLVLEGKRLPPLSDSREELRLLDPQEHGARSFAPISQKLADLIEVAGSQVVRDERFPPTLYYTDQFNAKGIVEPRLFHISIGRLPGLEYIPWLQIILADDIYFLDFSGLSEKEKAKGGAGAVLYRPLREQGFEHWYQVATFWYATFDQSYYADLATIVDLHRRKELNRALVLKQRSSLLDLIFGAGVFMETTSRNVIKITSAYGQTPGISYFYFVRSFPTIYFLTFNSSVWRLKTNPKIQGSWIEGNHRYKRYVDMEKEHSQETLTEIIKLSFKRREYFKEILES